MKALVFSEKGGLKVDANRAKPVPAVHEALIRVKRAGVCSTDLEIIKGYVPGYDGALGHEFVGVVEDCAAAPELVGQRVAGEINCNLDPEFSHPDATFVRSHAPKRVVLGIIVKDGCISEYITLPVENLHKAVKPRQRIAVIGDGKFGLLIAQNLVVAGHDGVIHFGRHQEKLDLVEGTTSELVAEDTSTKFAQAFDVCIEASGSSQGINLAAKLTRSLGTIVLKSTCSTVGDADAPSFAAIANDIVVQELTLVGSRCGPFPPALKALQDPRVKKLVAAMVSAEFPISQGIEAIEKAKTKGVLKVVITMDA